MSEYDSKKSTVLLWIMVYGALQNGYLLAPTYPFPTIDSPGFYRLAANVSNQIIISVSNVTLDMNGCTVSGGTNGLVINSGLTNITIKMVR
jgi:hypothetical protein